MAKQLTAVLVEEARCIVATDNPALSGVGIVRHEFTLAPGPGGANKQRGLGSSMPTERSPADVPHPPGATAGFWMPFTRTTFTAIPSACIQAIHATWLSRSFSRMPFTSTNTTAPSFHIT